MPATQIINRIIAEKGLKKCAVAQKAGYSPQQFSDMLKGRRKIHYDDVPKLCEALQITPNELFGYNRTA